MSLRVPPPLVTPALALGAVLLVGTGFVSVWPAPLDDAPALLEEGAVTDGTRGAEAPVPRPGFAPPLADVPALEQPVTMTPVVEDGVPRGLQLGPVHEGSLFARMGLVEGDLLLGFHDLGALDTPLFVAHIERAGRAMRVEYSVPARDSARATSAPSLASSLAGREPAAFVKPR